MFSLLLGLKKSDELTSIEKNVERKILKFIGKSQKSSKRLKINKQKDKTLKKEIKRKVINSLVLCQIFTVKTEKLDMLESSQPKEVI